MTRILFILKRRGGYDFPQQCDDYSTSKSSGLLHSAAFVVKMLEQAGVECKLVEVTDNNDIDREVAVYHPTHVIIEALWVVPEKYDILVKLHPRVEWIVRLHSNAPFLANEGVATDWIVRCLKHKNVKVAVNSPMAYRDLWKLLKVSNTPESADKLLYLPNAYQFSYQRPVPQKRNHWTIGSFGAVRPFKNQYSQALAAIQFAKSTGKHLRFLINGTRNEQGGENVLKNIRAAFAATSFELVEVDWISHDRFVDLLATLDVSMCVSFTETFCLVAADSVSQGVPVVASKEVAWIHPICFSNPTDVDSIVATLRRVTNPMMRKALIWANQRSLQKVSRQAREDWLKYFAG